MSNYEEQKSFADVNFDVSQEERIRRFLELFSPTYKSYLLDRTHTQMHSREFAIRIYYEEHSTLTLTCYSEEILKQRIQMIININKHARFINHNPKIEKQTFSLTINGNEDPIIYYTATLEFEFTEL